MALAAGVSVEKIIFWNKELASNCNRYGTRGRLAEVSTSSSSVTN